MAKRSKRIACFSLCGLILCINFLTVKAEALPDVMSGSTTLADNIMTYYALSGSAVANTDWINTLYNSYGSSFGTIEELANEGYLVLNDAGMWEPVEQLGQMIEQAPAYSSLGLNEMFNVSAEEAAAGGGFAAASGGPILAGSLGGVASTGIVPLFGGVTAAYWGGITLGTLVNHLVDKYKDYIQRGATIDTANNLMQQHPNFYVNTFKNLNNQTQYIFTPPNCRTIGLNNYSDEYLDIYCVNPTDSTKIWYYSENGSSRTRSCQQNLSVNLGNIYKNYSYNGLNIDYSNKSILDEYARGIRPLPAIKSPDLIGENGNLESQEDDGNITVPDMKPQIDPGTQAGKPLTLPDWLAFANAVQNNNNNVNPTPDGNKGLFDDILDLIKTVNPSPGPNPDPNPDPWSPPVVTPVPDPSYPDPVPDQQITENPQESENPQQTENPIDTGKPWRLPDLRQKFPFCIPWDIAKIFSKLKVNARQAPHISWRFNPPNTPIDYTFNLDLEDFEEVASLLRTLELMGFIVGLAFVTRYLIGAN